MALGCCCLSSRSYKVPPWNILQPFIWSRKRWTIKLGIEHSSDQWPSHSILQHAIHNNLLSLSRIRPPSWCGAASGWVRHQTVVQVVVVRTLVCRDKTVFICHDRIVCVSWLDGHCMSCQDGLLYCDTVSLKTMSLYCDRLCQPPPPSPHADG